MIRHTEARPSVNASVYFGLWMCRLPGKGLATELYELSNYLGVYIVCRKLVQHIVGVYQRNLHALNLFKVTIAALLHTSMQGLWCGVCKYASTSLAWR